MNVSTPNEQAQDAFIASLAKSAMLAERIQETLNNHLGVNPDTLNWGHVGNIQHVQELLEEIAEFLNLPVN
jgi:hypothetical protein